VNPHLKARLKARLEARLKSQAGVTLVELVVATGLISVVMAVFMPLLASATRATHPMEVQSQAIDSLRTSLGTIGRELRSAVCVSQPAPISSATASTGSGNVLTFSTDANGAQYTVTYTVTGGQLLRQKQGQSSVTLVASGLVSPDDAFTYIATPRRTVRVRLHFQPDPKRPSKELSTVMAGRNAWHNCPSS
jgi:type II secretory pathway pseudopilin PulG